jgi:hypothetical protein
MMAWCSRFASLLLAATALGLAQDEAAGVASFIDIEGAGTWVAACLEREGDPRACVPNVETLALEPYRACRGSLAGCEEKMAYPAPFIPEASGQAVESDMQAAWDTYIARAIDEVNAHLNPLPPCWLPTPCPPAVDWACVAERLAEAVAIILRDHLPAYWADVYASLATNAPLALHWQSLLPGDGAVIAPVFSLTPKPGQYAGLVVEPRDAAYYFQGPLFPRLSVPYAPVELNPAYGGLTEKEDAKRSLEPATLLEYQQFGFAVFFQVFGEMWLGVVFDLTRGPYLAGACLIPIPPFLVLVPVPVPTPLYSPRVFSAWLSVPEGYPIPRVRGVPRY